MQPTVAIRRDRLIKPHGGRLVNKILVSDARDDAIAKARSLNRIALNARTMSDLELIAVGAFSPLEGFMGQADYSTVLTEMRLANGLPWSLPITLAVRESDAESLKVGEEVALVAPWDELLGLLHLEEKFRFDKKEEARLVYGTEEERHPGVAYLYTRGELLLAGKIDLVNHPLLAGFEAYRRDPAETRAFFEANGWRTVVGFQTRNPIHRSHEYIQKCALELMDGILIHPLVGKTKLDDIPSEVRLRCYQALIEHYYPKDRVLLSVFPGAMRYAGPREAIFHALVRKNYGCTHFIVGRDHAGVGNFYHPFAAHEIFRKFSREELDIVPLFFDETFFCKRCGAVASPKTCPHPKEERVALSGTRVRELLSQGESLPPEFTRPEVAEVLAEWIQSGSA
jgi:sulfate adenylyltransferase